jgi:hypothetical protein
VRHVDHRLDRIAWRTIARQERAGAPSGVQAISRVFGQTLGAALAALRFGLFALGATSACLLLAFELTVAAAFIRIRRGRLLTTENN